VDEVEEGVYDGARDVDEVQEELDDEGWNYVVHLLRRSTADDYGH